MAPKSNINAKETYNFYDSINDNLLNKLNNKLSSK